MPYHPSLRLSIFRFNLQRVHNYSTMSPKTPMYMRMHFLYLLSLGLTIGLWQNTFYHIRRQSHSVAKSVIYGKRVPQYTSPEAIEYFSVLHEFEHILAPGTYPPIDLFPFLKWVPDRWAPWMKACYAFRDRRNKIVYGLYEECEQRVAQGADANSFIENILHQKKDYDLDRDEIA